MHAAAGTENEPPGPGSTGQYEPGIWRDDDDGRSIDSSGVGGVAAACWRQRSTLKATPPWPFAHSRERMPLRSEPTNASGGGHTRSETRSVVFGVDDLSFRCPVCTRTATRSLSSEYTSVPHSWFSFTGFPSPDRYLDGSSTSTSEFIFFLSAGTTHGAYTRTSGSEASARAFFAPAPSAASGAPRFITHAEEGARQATGGTCDAGDGSEAGDGATQIPLLRFRPRVAGGAYDSVRSLPDASRRRRRRAAGRPSKMAAMAARATDGSPSKILLENWSLTAAGHW